MSGCVCMNALLVDNMAPADHVYCDASVRDGISGLQVTPRLLSQQLVQGSALLCFPQGIQCALYFCVLHDEAVQKNYYKIIIQNNYIKINSFVIIITY